VLANPAYSVDPRLADANPGTASPPGRPACVLVVDDDPSMQQMLVNYLSQHNIHVQAATRRQDVARQLARSEPSVVILDLHLGQDDGLDLLRELRARSDVPVIITTGHRRDEIDRVVGLELGADDYVIKPFGLREMLARIRAVLRRQELGRIASHRDAEQGRYRFAGWQRVSMKMCSIAASTCRSCACGESWKLTPARHG
jgi:two-component system, OmpR family, response regulator